MSKRALKSVADGWASLFNLSGSIQSSLPDYQDGPARDGRALRGDWNKTGNDIRNGIELVAQE